VSLADNTLALYSVSLTDSKEVKLIRKISLNGHRSNVKVLSFSSDNLALFTGGSESVKMWNRKTLNCIRTVETISPVQCLCVVPGDRHILAGLENGNLLVIDIAAGDIIENITAHLKDMKSIYMLPDEVRKNCSLLYCFHTIFIFISSISQLGCVTGGGDNTVKLWQLELVTLSSSDKKVLSLLHMKTLELDENVQCAKVSPDHKLLAVALLDNTVKIFFMDTFKVCFRLIKNYSYLLDIFTFLC